LRKTPTGVRDIRTSATIKRCARATYAALRDSPRPRRVILIHIAAAEDEFGTRSSRLNAGKELGLLADRHLIIRRLLSQIAPFPTGCRGDQIAAIPQLIVASL
jgi:hypothetical protein